MSFVLDDLVGPPEDYGVVLTRYNSEMSFHRFPVDPKVQAQWLTQIRRDNCSPLQSIVFFGGSHHFQLMVGMTEEVAGRAVIGRLSNSKNIAA
ncbi:hypothetical protein NFI96_000793 [Prochilodus magdalenae]|nr:hypothetical protein NFI96_000793 [Prochilodus magdalenae]